MLPGIRLDQLVVDAALLEVVAASLVEVAPGLITAFTSAWLIALTLRCTETLVGKIYQNFISFNFVALISFGVLLVLAFHQGII